MQRIRSPTSKLRAQLLSLTLGMGTIVAETCKLLNSEAGDEHIKSTHFKKIGYRDSPNQTTCCAMKMT